MRGSGPRSSSVRSRMAAPPTVVISSDIGSPSRKRAVDARQVAARSATSGCVLADPKAIGDRAPGLERGVAMRPRSSVGGLGVVPTHRVEHRPMLVLREAGPIGIHPEERLRPNTPHPLPQGLDLLL